MWSASSMFAVTTQCLVLLIQHHREIISTAFVDLYSKRGLSLCNKARLEGVKSRGKVKKKHMITSFFHQMEQYKLGN